MRSAPTLKIWMTPLASVAMLEKLALLKIALCSAPALSSTSSACVRAECSAPSMPSIRILAPAFSLFMVLPNNACSRSTLPARRPDRATAKLHGEQIFDGVLELKLRVRLLQELCALNKQRGHFFADGV